MRKSRARVSAAITRAATTSAAAVLHTFDGFDDEVPLHTTHSGWFHTRVTISFGTLFLFLFGTSSPLTRWSGDEYLCKPQHAVVARNQDAVDRRRAIANAGQNPMNVHDQRPGSSTESRTGSFGPSGRAPGASASDISADLDTLRADFNALKDTVTSFIAKRGSDAVDSAK